jgi:hypothetical protein
MSIKIAMQGSPDRPQGLADFSNSQLLEALMDISKELRTREDRNCYTCIKLDGNTERCKMSNPCVRPPLHILVKGCELWEDIPF